MQILFDERRLRMWHKMDRTFRVRSRSARSTFGYPSDWNDRKGNFFFIIDHYRIIIKLIKLKNMYETDVVAAVANAELVDSCVRTGIGRQGDREIRR